MRQNESLAENQSLADDAPLDAAALPRAAAAERSGSGRAVAALALLAALGATALAGYACWLAWQVAQDDAGAALRTQLAAQAQRAKDDTQALRTELDRLAARVEEQLSALQQRQQQQRELVAQATAQSDRATPGGWRLAEVEYLMRVANHRLLMERDGRGAENLLALADQLLLESGLAYHDVRVLLAAEMAALRAFEGVDTQGIFLRLDALKGLLDQLPLRLPEYSTAAAASVAPRPNATPRPGGQQPSMLEALARRLSGLVRFRRHEGGTLRPLLPPRQADYLQLHLQLALDRAQLAALRHDQHIYRASLTTALEWLRRFINSDGAAARRLASELDALLAIHLDLPLPDISQSLARLRELAEAAPTPVGGQGT